MEKTEVTLKNTKAEIFKALNQSLARVKQLESGKLNPEKDERERLEKKAVEISQQAVEQKNIFSQELNDKFNNLQVAIAAEENRLQELYSVGRELQKLAVIIESQNEQELRFNMEMTEKEEAAKQRLNDLQSEYTVKNAEMQAEYDAYSKKLKLERTREAEEYQYNLTRNREKENNAWEDEKSSREAALKAMEKIASDLLLEAENKRDYIISLEEKVNEIPTLIEAEKSIAMAEITQQMQKEFDYKTTLMQKDSQSAISRLEDKVEHLEKELDVAVKSSVLLQNKLDKSYSEMRDLATKTVESASGVKIIGNAENKL